MNMSVTMKVKAESFRKLDSPYENVESKKYIFYVKVDDVAEGIPMGTNPREQKLTTPVAKAISESLLSNDGYFHLKNRGIVLSAESVHFNNRREEVTLKFSDSLAHGNVDGGHTYKIVCEHKGENLDQYVQFEVITGVEDIIEGLAEARNTSIQVDQKSLAELAKHFDPVKEALEGMPFFKRISFKQNQTAKDGESDKNLKMIDVREVVAIISMFDIDRYGENSHPIKAYSSKEGMLKQYLENPENCRKYSNVIPDFFDLYDAIETEFATAYNSNGGKYGRKKYAGYKDGKVVGKSKFCEIDMTYRIPDGLIYPVLAAFRSLLYYNRETEKFEWDQGLNPLDVWKTSKVLLASKIMSMSSSIGDNPNSVGKDPDIWDMMYMKVKYSGRKE